MRANLDNVDINRVEIVGNVRNGVPVTGARFYDDNGSSITLWSTGDLRIPLQRALSRLDAIHSRDESRYGKGKLDVDK